MRKDHRTRDIKVERNYWGGRVRQEGQGAEDTCGKEDQQQTIMLKIS